MGAPEPSLSFSIPSVHDRLVLDCRVYHPSDLSSTKFWKTTAVILAHPYAKLGGCYDVPVIHAATSALLKDGVTVGTFNFRGASGSAGGTSWTGKAEVADYQSFAGFLANYMRALNSRPRMEQPTAKPIDKSIEEQVRKRGLIDLVFGGYSYGSLIVRRLPPLDEMLMRFSDPAEETAELEIVTKARDLAAETISSIENNTAVGSPTRSLRLGDARVRQSHETHRSSELLHEIPKALKSLGKKHAESDSDECAKLSPSNASTNVIPFYLLISPPLQFISSLVQLPIGYTFAETECATWTKNPTLAIFGDSDAFTSAKNYLAWAQNAESVNKDFQYVAVASAGHFWGEAGVLGKMKSAIRAWLQQKVLLDTSGIS
jgi:alpha/beta superfamily hydrolase